jgi:GT2 family glycosyltransferase
MNRLLSVGITTRDRPDALRACIESLARIAHLDPEIIVFDDGSRPSVEVQLQPTQTPARLRILRDDASPGYITGRNRLVRASSSPFVLLLDDDTRLLSGASIERALAVLRDDPSIAAVGFAQAEADGRPWPASMQPSTATVPVVVPSYIGFAHLLRRDVFLQLSGYRESFRFYGEEKDFCLRLLDAGYRTVYIPDALVAHVSDRASRSAQRYLRFVARNDCLNTLYNDPLTRAAWMLPARIALYFRMRRAWKIADPWGWLWLGRELLSNLPAVLAERQPVSRRTIALWKTLKTTETRYATAAGDSSISDRRLDIAAAGTSHVR